MTNDDRERRAGGTQTSGMPSSRCMLARGPMTSNKPRDDVHDHVAVAQRPNDVHGLAVRLVRERDDDAIDAVLVHERPQVVELTERCDATRFRPALERLGVDEADEIEPVFGVLTDLPGDELADLARTDDERAHGVRARAPGEGPCDGASRSSREPIASSQNATRRPSCGDASPRHP